MKDLQHILQSCLTSSSSGSDQNFNKTKGFLTLQVRKRCVERYGNIWQLGTKQLDIARTCRSCISHISCFCSTAKCGNERTNYLLQEDMRLEKDENQAPGLGTAQIPSNLSICLRFFNFYSEYLADLATCAGYLPILLVSTSVGAHMPMSTSIPSQRHLHSKCSATRRGQCGLALADQIGCPLEFERRDLPEDSVDSAQVQVQLEKLNL